MESLIRDWNAVATYQTMISPSKVKKLINIDEEFELAKSISDDKKNKEEHESSKKVKAVLPAGVGLKVDVFA